MWRFLLPASVMVGALVVLLAGALGNMPSLPNLSAEFPALIANVVPQRTNVSTPDVARTAPAPAGPPAVAAPQPDPAAHVQQVADALQRQVAELQAQITQGSKDLASLRSNEDQAHHELDTLHQQRQEAEAEVARLQSQQRQLAAATPPDTRTASTSASAGTPAVVAQQATPIQQTANDALQRQATDLQAQIKQCSQELASLRANEDQAHHELDTLRQQRVEEDAAVARLQSQQRQLTAAKPANTPTQPWSQQHGPQPVSAPAPNTPTQTALAQLRANEQASQPLPQQPAQPAASVRQGTPATQPVLIVSSRGVLVTARELLASGRAADARQLLVKAQAQTALRPVTPDQPFATGGNVAATQIRDAIRLLDAGNTGSAMQAINMAMDSTSDGASPWPTYPQAAAGYPGRPTYYNGDQR